MSKDLNKLIWLGLPIIILLIPYVSRFATEKAYMFMYMESGWVEVSTVFFLILSIVFSLLFIKVHNFTGHKWFKWWVALLILGCIYFAGEEISWGAAFIWLGNAKRMGRYK